MLDHLAAIKTERLYLARLNAMPENLRQMVEWLNDPEVTWFSEQKNYRHTEDSQREYLQHILDSPDLEYWTITVSDKDRLLGKPIGSIAFEKRDTAANIGIMIGDKPSWGQGYALEAMTAIINHLIGRGFKRFEIGTMKDNERMIKLATACGMKEEFRNGEYVYMAAVI